MVLKRLIFILLSTAFIIQVYAQRFDSTSIKIISYNIWYDNPDNKENPWSIRKTGVKETIERLQPDIFCVQEAMDNQVHDLEFLTYKYYGVGRDDGKSLGEYSAIYYDEHRFYLEEGGNFWLSEFPDSAGSFGWDAACVRIATWIKLFDKSSGKEIFVFNTHFDHVGDTARLESAKLLVKKINEIAIDFPIILTGDFNCKFGSNPFQVITDQGNEKSLFDSRYIAEKKSQAPDYTYVGYNFIGEPGEIIDHIFVSKEFNVLESYIEKNFNKSKCPSDHLPVVAEVIIW